VHTNQLNLETLRSRAAAPPRPDAQLISLIPRPEPPPGRRRPRGIAAAGLARIARRLDGDAARRAIA
jgi:hypothetical protein